MFHAKLSEDCGNIGVVTMTDSGTNYNSVDFNAKGCRAGPRFVIVYFSENSALTTIAALVAVSEYGMEISSIYRSSSIPSLRTLTLGSAEDCVIPRQSRKALISLCHSCGACLSP